jgi:hypothetical protein
LVVDITNSFIQLNLVQIYANIRINGRKNIKLDLIFFNAGSEVYAPEVNGNGKRGYTLVDCTIKIIIPEYTDQNSKEIVAVKEILGELSWSVLPKEIKAEQNAILLIMEHK